MATYPRRDGWWQALSTLVFVWATRARGAPGLTGGVFLNPVVATPEERPLRQLLTRPVVFNMEPVIDFPFGRNGFVDLFDVSDLVPLGLGPNPLGALDLMARWHDVSSELQGGRRPRSNREAHSSIFDGPLGRTARSDAFEVRGSGRHFQIRASLPGFQMHSHGVSDQPLFVEVVGDSLLVRGWQSSGPVVSSFQRSFRLPQKADTDAIHVSYNASDGELLVDVPIRDAAISEGVLPRAKTSNNSHVEDMQQLVPLDSGSQTTVTFNSLAKDAHVGHPFLDEVLGLLMGPQIGAAVPRDIPTSLWSKPRVSHNAFAVHTRNAKPFWRYLDKEKSSVGPAIEIVVPRGTVLGKPHHSHVPAYSDSDHGLRGARTPIGRVALPVSVWDDDCTWVADRVSAWMIGLGGFLVTVAVALLLYSTRHRAFRVKPCSSTSVLRELSFLEAIIVIIFGVLLVGLLVSMYLADRESHKFDERVLRCKIRPDSVKKVNINVMGEL